MMERQNEAPLTREILGETLATLERGALRVVVCPVFVVTTVGWRWFLRRAVDDIPWMHSPSVVGLQVDATEFSHIRANVFLHFAERECG